jgi:hypothetical protein
MRLGGLRLAGWLCGSVPGLRDGRSGQARAEQRDQRERDSPVARGRRGSDGKSLGT